MTKSWGAIPVHSPNDWTFVAGDLELRVAGPVGAKKLTVHGSQLSPRDWDRAALSLVLDSGHPTEVLPATPDLPLVVRPTPSISADPGTSVRLTLTAPIWVQLISGRNRGVVRDIPARTLKRTWFGTPDSGEPAYSLTYEDPVDPDHHEVTIPVEIHNASQAQLVVDRLIVRVVHLGIYRVGDRLVTNTVQVAFRGSEQVSQVSYGGPPPGHQDSRPLASRRSEPTSDILRRSFLLLKDLTWG